MKSIIFFIVGFFFGNHIVLCQSEVLFTGVDHTIEIKVEENVLMKCMDSKLPVVEPSITAHPENEKIFLAAAMVITDIQRPYESARLSSFYSEDGGQSWIETQHDYWGYDPWVSISKGGKASMTWLGTKGKFKHLFPLQIFKSEDAGKNWNSSVEEFNGYNYGHDGTKVTGLKGHFYVSTVRFNGDHSADVVLYQSSHGAPFREVGSVAGKGRRLNFCEPGILSTGKVLVPTSYSEEQIWVSIYNPETGEIQERQTVSNNPRLGRGYMRMVVDAHIQSDFTDHVYLVRAVGKGNGSEGVWLNRSTDGGMTWEKEKRVDLFEDRVESKANVASVAVNHEGVVCITWMDRKPAATDGSFDLFCTMSRDGGETFQRPVLVTDKSSNPRTESNADVANKFIGGGHYLGLTSTSDGSFQVIWSDSRSGHFELYTSRLELSPKL